MHNSSRDMIAFVQEIGARLKTVVPRYQRRVSMSLPKPKESRAWLKTFLAVNARFASGDYRHTSKEFGDIAELAQWLINLHGAINNRTPQQLTIHEETMIKRERILG